MSRLMLKSLIGSGLLVLGLGIQTHAAPQRYVVFQDSQDVKRLFSQVRSDLDRAQHNAFPRDTDSTEKARGELNELEREWNHFQPTFRQADYVVSALERVLSENHLSFGDRGRLSDDLDKMRRFRDEHQ